MNIQQVERVLAENFEHIVPSRIEQPRHAMGFSGTTVFRVHSATEVLCLKCLPMSVDLVRQNAINELIKDVFDQGVTCLPVPVCSRMGSTLIRVDDGVWQLEPWMPGIADYWQQPSMVRLIAACHTLARWHIAARNSATTKSSGFTVDAAATVPTVRDRQLSLSRYLEGSLEQIEWRLVHEFGLVWQRLGTQITTHVRRLAPQLMADLMRAGDWLVPLQPVMRDVWHDHLLFSGDQVTGLIDFGATRTDTVAADLSRLLGSLVGADAEAWNCGLNAYEQLRPLSNNERQLLPLLDLSNVLLSGLTWLRRRYVDRVELVSEERVLERLERIADRLEPATKSLIWPA